MRPTAVVTGVSRELGRQLCRSLKDSGIRVFSLSLDDLRGTVGVNLFGAMQLAQRFAPVRSP
ncbi:hypothetical protein [Kutzneria sp. NPDC052558]|uniref:hypothetical protein n=1 Tax=Kutzneria sp. NPDC052558 TaxID=3364121 RepID=UPI0037CBA9E4